MIPGERAEAAAIATIVAVVAQHQVFVLCQKPLPHRVVDGPFTICQIRLREGPIANKDVSIPDSDVLSRQTDDSLDVIGVQETWIMGYDDVATSNGVPMA